MEKGLVSVVIPNLNYGHLLGETIDSVIAQTYKKWEIIVVDDNSTDNSRQLVNEYIEKYPQHDIRLFHNETGPSGTPTPINIGIKNMKGEYFAWLSSDDVFMPEKLEKQVRFLEENPGVGLVHTSFHVIDDNSVITSKHHVENLDRPEFFINSFQKNLINGNTVLIRRSVFDKVGVYMATHPLFPCVWYVAEVLKHLEIVMHYDIVGMKELLHKTRIHQGNWTFNHSSLGKKIYGVAKKFFFKQYPVSKIVDLLDIPEQERADFLIRLWDAAQLDMIGGAFLVEQPGLYSRDFIEKADRLEYIKLGIAIITQLVVNRKIALAEKQLRKLNEYMDDQSYGLVKDLKYNGVMDILKAGKEHFNDGDMELSGPIFQLISGDRFAPKNLKLSAMYYYALVLKETGDLTGLKTVLEELLDLEPSHGAARKLLDEL